MNKTDLDTFKNLCQIKEKTILGFVAQYLRAKYDNVIETEFYTIATGDIPVALVAHADTVFTGVPQTFFHDREKDVLWSPEGMGADDRAGVFAILKIISLGLRPHVIITTGEEQGCIGADALTIDYPVFPAPLNFMVELDRHGKNDSVYYDCANIEFEQFINTFGFETNWGTYSDISVLAEQFGVAAVNLSVGYFNEHKQTEHIYLGVLEDTIDKVVAMLEHAQEFPHAYKFVPAPTISYQYWGHYQSPKRGCGFCLDERIPDKDLLSIYFDEDAQIPERICQDCYTSFRNDLRKCVKCGKTYFILSSDIRPKQNWVCTNCEKKENANDSRAKPF